MMLTRAYCQVCRDSTLHGKHALCIRCGTSGVTHAAAFRPDIDLNEGKGIARSRKRGGKIAQARAH